MEADVVRQIEAHIPSLRRYARLLVHDPDLADDMVQDCLERAVSRLHLYREDVNLRGWLFTILLNVVRSHGRKAGRRRWVPIEDHQDSLLSIPRQGDSLRLRDLWRAFAQLPESFQEVIVLVAIEGLAYEEAARIMDIPVGTVRSRLSRARTQLRRKMDGTEPMGAREAVGTASLERLRALLTGDAEPVPAG